MINNRWSILSEAACFNTWGCFSGDSVIEKSTMEEGTVLYAKILFGEKLDQGSKKWQRVRSTCELHIQLQSGVQTLSTAGGSINSRVLFNEKYEHISPKNVTVVKPNEEMIPWVEKIQHLFMNEQSKDVTLLVEGKEIKAHAGWLMVSSPKFKELLIDSKHRRIKLNGYSYEPFKIVIDYLYGKNIEFTSKDVFLILYIAVQFQIEELIKTCDDFIKKDASSATVLHYLHQFNKIPDHSHLYFFKIHCLDYLIGLHLYELFQENSEAPYLISLKQMKAIVAYDFEPLKNLELSTAVLQWIAVNKPSDEEREDLMKKFFLDRADALRFKLDNINDLLNFTVGL